MSNKINDYDWLHLHHEDFTGQYGKFYRSYRNKPWYKMESDFNATAKKHGFSCVHNLKKFIALKIKKIFLMEVFYLQCAQGRTHLILR